MSYRVTARKWRPQNFESVIFQDHVSQTLKNSITAERISHAYLFTGPRGVGKTTMARILAKALNCENGPSANPCGKCGNCIEVTKGSSFDVIEIDGASNRGIDDIKELRENVNFAPLKARYKIYIIDEVHMLTREAFNALLKTLEEPPPHVVFIFATTEYHKIPDTILSRCQKFFFKEIPIEPIVDHLRYICKEDGFNISDNALYPIARAADGSMRDAQSLLDQVISFSTGADSNKEIREDDSLAILGIVPLDSYILLLGFVADMNSAGVIDEVEKVRSIGGDVTRYVSGLADMIRAIRLIKNNISVKEILNLSDSEIDSITILAEKFFDEELSRFFQIIIDLQRNLKSSSDERIILEMSLLDMISVKKTPSLVEIISKLESSSLKDIQVEKKIISASEKKNDEKSNIQIEKKNEKNLEKRDISQKEFKKIWIDFLAFLSEKDSYTMNILNASKVIFTENKLLISPPLNVENLRDKIVLDKKLYLLIKDSISLKTGVKVDVEFVCNPSKTENTEDSMDQNLENKHSSENKTVEKVKDFFHGQIVDKGE